MNKSAILFFIVAATVIVAAIFAALYSRKIYRILNRVPPLNEGEYIETRRGYIWETIPGKEIHLRKPVTIKFDPVDFQWDGYTITSDWKDDGKIETRKLMMTNVRNVYTTGSRHITYKQVGPTIEVWHGDKRARVLIPKPQKCPPCPAPT